MNIMVRGSFEREWIRRKEKGSEEEQKLDRGERNLKKKKKLKKCEFDMPASLVNPEP